MKPTLGLSRLRSRKVLGLIAALAITTGLAACSSTTSTSAGGSKKSCVTKYLLVSNVTGAGAANGVANEAGATAAAKFINSHGGVLGCKLELTFEDDGSDYTKTLPLVQGATAQGTYASVIVGDYGAPSVAPYLTRQKQLGFVTSGVLGLADPKVNPDLFDTVVPSIYTAGPLMKYAVGTKGYKNIAVLTDTTATGGAAVQAYVDAAEKNGGKAVTTQRIDLSSVNMTPAVQTLEASHPDAIVANIYGPAMAYFLRDLKASGATTPVFGGTSVFATNLASLIPAADYSNLVVSGPAVGTLPSSPGAQAMIDAIKAQGVTINAGLSLYAQAHDAVILSAFGENGAKSLDAAKVTAYLNKNGTKTVPGLAMATTSGYSATDHYWHPANGVALAKAGNLNDGRLTKVNTAG